MIQFQRTRMIDANPDAVWRVLGRFMQVDEIAPAIVSVEALTSGEPGIGSKRRNIFENGSSLVEEIIDWQPGQGFAVQLSEMDAMPLKEAQAKISITPVAGRSEVTWGFCYRVKFGPFGWILGQTLMKMMMGKVLDQNLAGLEAKVLTRS